MQEPVASIQKRWHVHTLALGIYAICALVVTWPLATRLGDAFIANTFGRVDGFLSIWNLWWAAEAIRTGYNPFHTPMLFHPQGLDLFWLWLSFPNGLLAAPLTLTLGPLTAYNLTILGSYLLGGYAAFLFIRRFVHDDAAAMVGGALYALTPFHMRRVLDAVMDTATIQWVPLYLLALHCLLDRPRWWKALLCGLLVLWVGLGSWYYGLFCLIYTGMAAVVWAVSRQYIPLSPWKRGDPGTPVVEESGARSQERGVRSEESGARSQESGAVISGRRSPVAGLDWRRLAWGLMPGVIWALLVAPQLLSLIQNGDRQFGVGLHANDSNSADLIDFFLPNPFHPLWGARLTAWYTELRPDAWLWQVSFGWVALVLAALGLRVRWRETRRWLVLLGATMLLALGERLHVLGQSTGIPMPYALLAGLPGIRTSHRPNHILLIGMLLLALIAAYGAATLFRRVGKARWGAAFGLTAAALLIDGWAGPLPLYSLPIPDAYRTVLPAYSGGAILPIPVNLNVARAEQLWYQTAHGWPIIGGYTGREPPYPIGKYAPGIRELRYGRYEPDDIITPGWPGAQRAMLAALDVRYVAFHPDLMGDSVDRQRELIADMGLTASYHDARLELYPVPQAEHSQVIGYLGDGWGGLEQREGRRWRWLGADPAELYLYNPHQTNQAVTIALHLEAYQSDRPLSISLDGATPITMHVTRAEMRRSIQLLLRPGQHVVYFSAPADPPESGSGPLRSVSFLGIIITE